jgi:aquaporin TIP
MDRSLQKRWGAEFVGTFTLVFVVILTADGPGGLLGAALADGFVVAALVASLGAISGAHFNPAVTLGFLAAQRIGGGAAALYWSAQLFGALAAAALLGWLVRPASVAAAVTHPAGELVSPLAALLLEALGTFVLVLVIFGTAVDVRAPRYVYPMAIGVAITALIVALGPLTGCAINPARALGPALVSGQWNAHWIYWAGPLLGGLGAALLQHYFLLPGGLPADAEAIAVA